MLRCLNLFRLLWDQNLHLHSYLIKGVAFIVISQNIRRQQYTPQYLGTRLSPTISVHISINGREMCFVVL